MTNEKYALTPATQPGCYTATDNENGVSITFRVGHLNDDQEVSLPDRPMDVSEMLTMPTILREMSDWLVKNHYDLCHPDVHDQRVKIGTRLRELRKERGLTVAQLARLANVTEANISRIENGKYSFAFDTLAKLANALGVDIELI